MKLYFYILCYYWSFIFLGLPSSRGQKIVHLLMKLRRTFQQQLLPEHCAAALTAIEWHTLINSASARSLRRVQEQCLVQGHRGMRRIFVDAVGGVVWIFHFLFAAALTPIKWLPGAIEAIGEGSLICRIIVMILIYRSTLWIIVVRQLVLRHGQLE